MMRARLIIDGDVQGVSFRVFAREVTVKMNVKGTVKNLDE